MATSVKFEKLECVKTTGDGAGKNDEIFITIDIDEGQTSGREPKEGHWSFSDLETKEIVDGTYAFDRSLFLRVVESDTGGDETVGTHTFEDGASSKSPIIMSGEESEYKLYFSYV